MNVQYSSFSDHAVLHGQWTITQEKVPLLEKKQKKYKKEHKEEFLKSFSLPSFYPNNTIENLESWAELWITQGVKTQNQVFKPESDRYKAKRTHADWWNLLCTNALKTYRSNPNQENSDKFRTTCRTVRRERVQGLLEAAQSEDGFQMAHWQ